MSRYFIRFLQVTFIYKHPLTVQVDISRDCIIDTHYLYMVIICASLSLLRIFKTSSFKRIENLSFSSMCTALVHVTVMVEWSIQPNS